MEREREKNGVGVRKRVIKRVERKELEKLLYKRKG